MRDFYPLLKVEGYVAEVYKEINGKALPVIGVTDKDLRTPENNDTCAIPSVDLSHQNA